MICVSKMLSGVLKFSQRTPVNEAGGLCCDLVSPAAGAGGLQPRTRGKDQPNAAHEEQDQQKIR